MYVFMYNITCISSISSSTAFEFVVVWETFMTMDFTMDFYDYCMDGWKFEFQMGFVSCNMIDSEVKCRVSEYFLSV